MNSLLADMGEKTILRTYFRKIREHFGIDKEKANLSLEKEIQSIIDEGEESGLLDENSGEMIQSILEFRRTVVREVMVPRTEMVALSVDTGLADIVEQIQKHGYTRIPVFHETLDNIVGILNAKDLFQFWNAAPNEGALISRLRPPYFIPETKTIHQLLLEFKQNKQHMAIVIDEYGGTSGLVTLEDLLEEIVGEISDEYDVEEKMMIDCADGGCLADGRVPIEEIGERFQIEIPEGKYETLAGFILHLLKRIPTAGENVQYDCLKMTIEEADERLIRKVKLIRLENAEGSEAGESGSERTARSLLRGKRADHV